MKNNATNVYPAARFLQEENKSFLLSFGKTILKENRLTSNLLESTDVLRELSSEKWIYTRLQFQSAFRGKL